MTPNQQRVLLAIFPARQTMMHWAHCWPLPVRNTTPSDKQQEVTSLEVKYTVQEVTSEVKQQEVTSLVKITTGSDIIRSQTPYRK